MVDQLKAMLGREHGLDDVNLALRDYISRLSPPAVGALHVTCADESEFECVESFQRWIVEPLLPNLHFTEKAPFRLANLGGRYEFGAVPVAEAHFATPESRQSFKVMIVKISAHVAVSGFGAATRFGEMHRYGTASHACGALHKLLDGANGAFIDDLRAAFCAGEKDRLQVLLDEKQVSPAQRAFLAAIVNALLQAARAVQDIKNHAPASPTLYLVPACVTLNRPERDTEFFCGLNVCDCRTPDFRVNYYGLGDNPAQYRLACEPLGLQLTDDDGLL
ncbi:MAG TPA: hypothetical protein PK920_06600 [Phycisphaerae bacterium]|jgi:hypothetical protein|nr:hypothetical protein [Phycisphaerae bacterium]HPC22138.1 hypothetical protein [Phycisphaerae bacterium]HRS27163.1 hypothetical protein [Phycisphaerae bacterium]HRT41001.1 hypothetical protein [Phycisphaerae bacterium]